MALVLEGTKERVLDLLRLRPYTAKELAEALGVSRVAVLKHLQDLEARGLVRSEVRKCPGRGRPYRVYRASDGEAPYAAFCGDVLEGLERVLGREGVVHLLLERNRSLFASLNLEALPLRERLARLAQFLREQGYEAEVVEEGGRLYLCQKRCPKLALSREHEALCQSELLAYQELLGLPLVREERLAEGGSCCRYRVE
ncbi:transcriptional regulator [Thermus scotoductus]|uniref:Transcriptional regulator n=1 Tax=Thermus scotoductus TaxID=37636 RepID=A0A430QUY5_THESC|nr:HTH domain-containing protein [Thermus scotoductus]RTG91983.1 transcriptional regulator [Thermus scotoductus]RTG93256.1 transcriptional regulator [Thermus scotoductus]RTG94590.1 transcriptional regulator [Thermus scotoductus]RTG98650.1 transcriptional regulator [Thermus scotoductus]RTH00972.1 transcriptional regulator [Thermus scotoductus]